MDDETEAKDIGERDPGLLPDPATGERGDHGNSPPGTSLRGGSADPAGVAENDDDAPAEDADEREDAGGSPI
jgi:hypothetical protein